MPRLRIRVFPSHPQRKGRLMKQKAWMWRKLRKKGLRMKFFTYSSLFILHRKQGYNVKDLVRKLPSYENQLATQPQSKNPAQKNIVPTPKKAPPTSVGEVFNNNDTFASMKLHPRLLRNLTDECIFNLCPLPFLMIAKMAHSNPTQIQSKSIPVLLSGKDAFLKVTTLPFLSFPYHRLKQEVGRLLLTYFLLSNLLRVKMEFRERTELMVLSSILSLLSLYSFLSPSLAIWVCVLSLSVLLSLLTMNSISNFPHPRTLSPDLRSFGKARSSVRVARSWAHHRRRETKIRKSKAAQRLPYSRRHSRPAFRLFPLIPLVFASLLFSLFSLSPRPLLINRSLESDHKLQTG